jgi:hypothetical protein
MGRAVLHSFLLSCFAIVLCNSALMMASDFPPLNAAELKITSCPQQPGASAYILYREEENDDREHFHRVYERIKILTEEGRKHADIEIPYNSKLVRLKDIKGRTIHSDATMVALEGKPIEKEMLRGRDIHYKAKVFTMPDVRVGDVLEFTYKVNYDADVLWPARWVISQDMYQEKVHLTFAPGSLDYSYTWNTPGNVKPQQKSGKIEFEAEKIPAFEEEEYMLPSVLLKYYVYFYYNHSHTQTAEDFWNFRGKFLSDWIENYKSKHKNIDQQLSALVTAADTPEQKARKIYSFVQSLENTSYIPDRTEKEEKSLGLKDSECAEDVLRQKSGDRNELTLLFAAMAQRAGIPVQIMYVTQRDTSFFMPQLFDFAQLTTALAVIQIDGKDVFLDPGTPDAPYGQLYWKLTGSKGLRQTADLKGATLKETPPPTYNENIRRRTTRLEVQSDGTAEGTIKVAYSGQDAIWRRLRARETDAAGRTKLLEDEVKGWLPTDSEVKMTTTPEWASTDKPLVAVFDVKTPILTSAGRRYLLPSQILLSGENARFTHAERKWTVYFDYPYAEVDESFVKLPAGLQSEALPQAVNQRTDFGAYFTVYKQDSGMLYAARQLVMAGIFFKTDKYKDLKSFYDLAHTNDQTQVVLKNATTAQINNE